jgi:hypothetical protein
LAQSKGLLDLLYKSGRERSVDTYIVGSNEISNILIGKKDLNPSGRNTVPTTLAYSSKNPYTVGLNIVSDKIIDGMGSAYFYAQSNASNGGSGGQTVPTISYYAYVNNLDYYDVEDGLTYYEANIPPIQ